MRLKILPSALSDLREGWAFYENQEAGLGNYFQDSLFSDIDSLLLHAGIHKKVFGYHRLLSKRFPFAVYHKVEVGKQAVVWRVLDLRQNPKSIELSLG